MSAVGIQLLLSSLCYNSTYCGPVYDNPLLDNQLTKKQEDIIELSKELNGKHLRIGTVNNYPLSWVEEENGTAVGKGAAFVLVNILCKKFNFTYEVVTPERNWEGYSKRLEKSLLGLINNSLVDMGAAFIPVLYESMRVVKFSPGLDEGVWAMMLKRPKESAAGSGLLAPFDVHVWYLILAAVISFGPCITLLTWLRSRFVAAKEKHIPLSPSVWFVYGAFIKQGTSLSPEANPTRILFATWWIFIILLSSFYTANLTAFLTLSKFTLAIDTPKDLLKKNYRWVAKDGTAVEYVVRDPEEELHYLNRMVTNGRAQFKSTTSDRNFLPLVQAGAVLVQERVAIDHLMYGDYLLKVREGVEEEDRCVYVVTSTPFMKKIRAFAYPQNSTLPKLLDPVLNSLVEAGMVEHLVSRDLPSTKICPLDLQSKDRRLRNTDLLMTYYIMLTGLAAASATFVCEIFFRRYYNVKVTTYYGKSKRADPASEVRHISGDGQPPPYEALFGRHSKYRRAKNDERKIINGREYWVVSTLSGELRLIPVRTPSALLYQRK